MPEDPEDSENLDLPGLDEALAKVRPQPAVDGARRLRMQAMIASVLGPEHQAPTIDRFVVESKIGQGGMGVVYRGRDRQSQEPVAIKVLSAEAAEERERFEREAMALRAIRHPNVVRYLAHGRTEDGVDYLVMEWLEGCDLAARLAQGPLSVVETMRLGLCAAQALAAAHTARITHRDVKPHNLFLVDRSLENLRLIDFGIARSLRATQAGRLTATGAVVGSPQYMAPEQLRGVAEPRTDVYGLGATLFECLTGRAPFVGASAAATMLAVMAEPVPSVAAIRPDVPRGLDAMLGAMLGKDVRDRPADMAAVIAELAALIAHSGPLSSGRALSRAERSPATVRAIAPRKPSVAALVGRQRELGAISGLIDECLEEDRAAVVVVNGTAGVGKSALLEAIAKRYVIAGAWRVLRGTGSSADAGVPFGLLRSLVAASLASDSATAEARRFEALLTESVDELLRPGRDVVQIADRLGLAWLEVMESWTRHGPLLIVVDDLHRCDLSSQRLLDQALQSLHDRPLVVLASGRTRLGLESAAGERRLDWALAPLPPRAAQLLAEQWWQTLAPQASTVDAPRLAHLLDLAAGNPLHLLELLRSLADGRPLDGSLSDLVWQRLMAQPPEARQLLRAASIVGRSFWPSAIVALLGQRAHARGLDERLEELVAAGLLDRAPTSRVAGEVQYEFPSDLQHLAAYSLCTEEDLRFGHRQAADWLVEHLPHAPAAIAKHLERAGDRKEACLFFLAAARAALTGDESEAFEQLIADARACDPDANAAEQLDELVAEAAFWRGDLGRAMEVSEQRVARLAPQTEGWFRLTRLAITTAGQRGDNPRVRELAHALTSLDPATVAADMRGAHLEALCRAYTQLEVAERRSATDVLVAAEGVFRAANEQVDPTALAWLLRARATAEAESSFDEVIANLVAAHRQHLAAGDVRSAVQIAVYLGSLFVWSAGWERAGEYIDEALSLSKRLRADYLSLWATYARGKLESETAPFATAAATLDDVIARTERSPRIRAGALLYRGLGALAADRPEQAERDAREAESLRPGPTVASAAAALRARSLLQIGRDTEAGSLRERLQPTDPPGAIIEFDELVRLARVEVTLRLDGKEAARHQADLAVRAIEQRARTLADPLRRNQYLARPRLVQITLELARSLGR